MIFQTFDKGFDRWTSKIGILGTSFHDLGIAIRTSFQSAQDAVRNPDSSAGFLDTFRKNLGSYTVSDQEYKRNRNGDIVTSQNIDSYIPKLTKEGADQKLTKLRKNQKKIQTGNGKSWSDFLPPDNEENKYLLDLIHQTEDLSDLTGNDLVEANQRARTAAIAHNEAIKAQTLSAKVGKVALQGLATAGGMVAGLLIAKGIELAVTAIDNLIHREERLEEAAKEASENIQNSFSSFQSMKQSTSSITQEFAELSQHVNQITGENIDLPEEEYQRFLELSNQLAETFPNIGYTIDENGNKITGLSGNVDEITQSINNLIQAQQTLTHQDISDNMEDVYKKSYKDIKKHKEEIETLEGQKGMISDVQEAADQLLSGNNVDFQINTDEDRKVYSSMVNMFQGVGMSLFLQEGKLHLNSTKEEADLSKEEIDQLEKEAQKINEFITADNQSIDKEIKKHQNRIQMSLDALAPETLSWLTTDQNYSNIVQSYGSELGTAIQKHVQALDPTEPDIKKWGSMETWINDHILAPLYDTDNEGLREAYTRLFTDMDLPLDSAMNYLDEIEKYYEENGISIPVIFKEQKKDLKQAKKNFDERNKKFKTGNVDGLNQFFQENSIDEADEYEKWCSVTEGITDATEAMEAWKRLKEDEQQPSLSFQESWDTIGTTGSDKDKQTALEAKEQLLQLAEAGKLTADELENSSVGTTIMDQTKLSAEEATEAVNQLVNKSSQLSALQSGIQPISDVLAQKQENLSRKETRTKGIDNSVLAGFDASIKGLDSWKEFEETLANGESNMEQCQQAASKLATEWVNSNNFLSQLDETNKDYYISQLKSIGIANAETVVTDALIKKKNGLNAEKKWLKATTSSLANASVEEINNLAKLKGWSNQTKNALYALALQKKLINGTTLDFSSDLSGIIEFVEKLGYSAEAMKTYQQVKAGKNGSAGMPSNVSEGYYGNNAQKEMDKILEKLKKPKKIKIDTPPKLNDNDTTENNITPAKEAKQSFNWLDRTITTLTQKVDLLKAKLENLFSVKAKNQNLNKQIKAVSKEVKAYSKEEKVYTRKAKSIKFSDKNLKKKIDNGQIKGKNYGQFVKEYGEKNAQQIQEYMDLKDKAATAKQNKAQAKKTKRELEIQKEQTWVDHHNAKNSQYDAEIENAVTAKEKNKLEDKKIKSTKKSYQRQIKVAKKTYGAKSPQVSELKQKKDKEIRDIKIEKQENLQNEAEGYRNQLNSQKEIAATAQEKNSYLATEVQYINKSYQAQIAIAKLQKNTALQSQLEADLQKELRDNKIEQLQNLSDEQSALYDLNQQSETNAEGAAEKNKFEAQSLENLKAQYSYEMQIAGEKGDLVEQERLRLELEQKTEESYQRQIDNIKEEYALITDLNNAKKATINAKIGALQANGYNVSTELYEEQQKLDQENYTKTVEEINKISLKMKDLSGDALTKAETELETLKQQAWEYQKAWAEVQKTINEINLAKIERIGTMLGYQSDDLNYMQDILSHSDFTPSDKETGGLTMAGLANAALTFAKMGNNNDQIANLYDQIAEKQRQLDSGEYTGHVDELEAEINELIQKAHELEKANYDSGESIKTLVIDSLNSLADALDENISKYKDALQAQKDLYDYRRKVADQLKSIASLEKQLGALQGSDTEEARARIQKLQIQLEEEQQNLKDMEYDKYLQDQEEILNKVSEDFQDFIASVANMSVSEICKGVGDVISNNLTKITASISEAFTESREISNIATSISGLSDAINQLQFSGRTKNWKDEDGNLHYEYTDNIGNLTHITKDNQGNVISVTENGQQVNIPQKTVTSTEAGTTFNNERQKVIDIINTYDKYALGRSSDYNTSLLLQYLKFEFGKTPTKEQEAALLQTLGVTNEDDAIRKLVSMGFYDSNNPNPYIPENTFIPFLISQKLNVDPKLLAKLRELQGFSQGGIATQLNKIALANGDDGWATLKRGESVLTPTQTEQFRKLTENLVPLNTIAESITSLPSNPVPVRHSPASNTVVRSVDIHLDGSHVMDVETFIKTLHNPKVLKEVSNGVSSQVNTMMSNKLGRF